MKKTNWKISIFIWAPSFFLISWLLFDFRMGVINAVIVGILAYIPVYLITKLFKLNMNIYYDHKGNKITKQEYEKLDNKVDYGFSWFPKSRKRKN